jgi:hypothetical protein
MCIGRMVFLLTLLALTWNFAAVLVGTILSSEVTVASCFFATLYMVIGIPGAWYTWCVPLISSLNAIILAKCRSLLKCIGGSCMIADSNTAGATKGKLMTI